MLKLSAAEDVVGADTFTMLRHASAAAYLDRISLSLAVTRTFRDTGDCSETEPKSIDAGFDTIDGSTSALSFNMKL